MARNTLTIYNAYALPTVATLVINPIVTALTTTSGANTNTWGALTFEFMVTTGTTAPVKGLEINLNWAFSNLQTTSPGGITHPQVFNTSSWLTNYASPTPSFTNYVNSGAIPILGDYLHTWLELPDVMQQIVTVTVQITQATFTTALVYAT